MEKEKHEIIKVTVNMDSDLKRKIKILLAKGSQYRNISNFVNEACRQLLQKETKGEQQ